MKQQLERWVRRNLVDPVAHRVSAGRNGSDSDPTVSVADVLGSPRRILLIPDGRPGGLFLAASRFWAIRRRYPDAKLDLLAHARREYIAREIPFVDYQMMYEDFVLPVGARRREVVRELQRRKYDIAFCFSSEDSFCPSYFCYKSGARLRVGFQRNDFSFFNIRIVPRSESVYEEDRLSLLLNVMGIPEVKEGVSWSVSTEGAKKIRDRYLVGAQANERMLGLDISAERGKPMGSRLMQIAKDAVQGSDTRVLIFFNYEERKEANRIRETLGQRVLMFQNEDLPRMVALLGACDEIVAGNTDVFHLAAAMGRPVTGIIPSREKIRWVPPDRGNVRVFDAETMSGDGAVKVTAAVRDRLKQAKSGERRGTLVT